MADPQLASFVFIGSGVLGFGPAIAVLYHALRTYDYPYTSRSFFETRRVVLALAVGMVLGTISGAITVGVRGSIVTLLSLVIVLLVLALFEEAFKLIYLNRKGYRARFDTTFAGVGLGVGIAAITAAGSAHTNGPALFSPEVFLPLFGWSVSLAFIHAATGAIIGFGCAKGDLVRTFAQAYVGRVLHAAMLVPFFVWSALPAGTSVVLPMFSLAAATAFTIALYRYVYGSVLPGSLPPEMRSERRRRARAGRAGQTVRK